jgi:choline dehydrogenase
MVRVISRQADWEYVVIGSGAGGGTLAARLAESGRKILVLEAGGDPRQLSGGDPHESETNRLPDDYDVPVFHGFASENDAIKWDFFVRHYEDTQFQRQDEKYREFWKGERVDGVLYPRASALGGCTAHNAMILVYPHNADWDGIASSTGDDSWRARNMRRYFERLENCQHRLFPYRWLSNLGLNPTRHGWHGWLQTEKSIPETALADQDIEKVLFNSAFAAFKALGHKIQNWRWLLWGQLDPNDWRLVRNDAVGICYTPLTTRGHQRMGTRERLLETSRKYPERLKIELDALATKVLFDEHSRAIGVEYLKGRNLYSAYGSQSNNSGERKEVYASKEVILAGGAFNTPQLLMRSGIGPQQELNRHDIATRIDLPGVGRNLQDRYEVGVVNRMKENWPVLAGARFSKGDPIYAQWADAKGRKGVYTSNGAVLGVIRKSFKERLLPDLFCFALLGLFKGYFPGYSALFANNLDYLTWAILKGHTNNRAGEVKLRSNNPQESPLVNFRYFDKKIDPNGEDLNSVVEGVKFVRQLTEKLKQDGLVVAEEVPGDSVQSDDDLREFVRKNAWGHHASCTCPIGSKENGGVVDGNFRVHGTTGLRVVDASVFPRIPGLFIASAIYMIAEKAADVILKDYS